MAMCNARFKPFSLTTEVSEWEGLWDKGVFKKWNRLGLLKNDRMKDYLQNFSPTPDIVIVRIITSIVAADDLQLHSIDIEQVFSSV